MIKNSQKDWQYWLDIAFLYSVVALILGVSEAQFFMIAYGLYVMFHYSYYDAKDLKEEYTTPIQIIMVFIIALIIAMVIVIPWVTICYTILLPISIFNPFLRTMMWKGACIDSLFWIAFKSKKTAFKKLHRLDWLMWWTRKSNINVNVVIDKGQEAWLILRQQYPNLITFNRMERIGITRDARRYITHRSNTYKPYTKNSIEEYISFNGDAHVLNTLRRDYIEIIKSQIGIDNLIPYKYEDK
jgi:hypothetical protein